MPLNKPCGFEAEFQMWASPVREVEFSMALTNRELSTEFDTVFLMTSLEYIYLHSSVVRQVAQMGGDVAKFVPSGVARRLRQHFGHD